MARLFNRIPIICEVCKQPIENDIDDYGIIGSHICKVCHFSILAEEEYGDCLYGMAPHGHNLEVTGSIIGSTILYDLSQYPQDDTGRYWIESSKAWFTPDDEVDGSMGIWEYEQPTSDGEKGNNNE